MRDATARVSVHQRSAATQGNISFSLSGTVSNSLGVPVEGATVEAVGQFNCDTTSQYPDPNLPSCYARSGPGRGRHGRRGPIHNLRAASGLREAGRAQERKHRLAGRADEPGLHGRDRDPLTAATVRARGTLVARPASCEGCRPPRRGLPELQSASADERSSSAPAVMIALNSGAPRDPGRPSRCSRQRSHRSVHPCPRRTWA